MKIIFNHELNMKKIFFVFLLFTLNLFSQEILKKDEIYTKDNLVYKVSNSELFTGKIQSFKRKDHLTFEIEFENGVIKKSILYYNGKEKIISNETYYYDNNRLIQKKISYSLDHKKIWIKYFNKLGEKTLEEDYVNGILVYSCPFLKNKKNGTVISINENGEKFECKFENGNLIKKQN